jgi:hypothetical protein
LRQVTSRVRLCETRRAGCRFPDLWPSSRKHGLTSLPADPSPESSCQQKSILIDSGFVKKMCVEAAAVAAPFPTSPQGRTELSWPPPAHSLGMSRPSTPRRFKGNVRHIPTIGGLVGRSFAGVTPSSRYDQGKSNPLSTFERSWDRGPHLGARRRLSWDGRAEPTSTRGSDPLR